MPGKVNKKNKMKRLRKDQSKKNVSINSEENEKIVEQIRVQQGLWDELHPDFHLKKGPLYEEIAKHLNMPVKKIKYRWRYLKESYCQRILKKSADGSKCPDTAIDRWLLEKMDFLKTQFISLGHSNENESSTADFSGNNNSRNKSLKQEVTDPLSILTIQMSESEDETLLNPDYHYQEDDEDDEPALTQEIIYANEFLADQKEDLRQNYTSNSPDILEVPVHNSTELERHGRKSFIDISRDQQPHDKHEDAPLNRAVLKNCISLTNVNNSNSSRAKTSSMQQPNLPRVVNITTLNETNVHGEATNPRTSHKKSDIENRDGYNRAYNNSSPSNPESDDYHFCMSLVPHFRHFTPLQKLNIRIKIQQILIEGATNRQNNSEANQWYKNCL